jgi:transcriptional regulator with XRE-family HTH domain
MFYSYFHYKIIKKGRISHMHKNETIEKLEKLTKTRGWSLYKLSIESELPYSSIENLFRRNTEPTLPTLRSLCNGLGISLSEFFSDEPAPFRTDYTLEERNLIVQFRSLRKTDRKLLLAYAAGLNKVLPDSIIANDVDTNADIPADEKS